MNAHAYLKSPNLWLLQDHIEMRMLKKKKIHQWRPLKQLLKCIICDPALINRDESLLYVLNTPIRTNLQSKPFSKKGCRFSRWNVARTTGG